MSLESWKKEFYPVHAAYVEPENALEHSLVKWAGLRDENLKRHNVERGGWGGGFNSYLRDPENRDMLGVDSGSCALCHQFEWTGGREKCAACPLFQARGARCDRRDPNTGERSPYTAWTESGDAEPMIALMESVKVTA